MAQLPGSDAKLIKLNPDWSVEKAASVAIEQNLSVNDIKGNRLIITLPGAGGFCNQELSTVKDNADQFKAAGVDEVIVIVGTDILTNAGHGLPCLLQDVDMEFAKANNLALDGVRSRYLTRSAIAVNASGEQVGRADAELLACRPLNALLDVAKSAFSS